MKARVLSAVLAILMILAVCPVIALSAADSTVSVWDGTVAGTDMTLKEMQLAFKAGNYTKVGVTASDIANDLDIGLTDKNKPGGTWSIKSAAGLAFISAWSNGYAEITDALTGQPGAANRVPMLYKDASWGKTINVTIDIDLNNEFWIPILAYDTSNTATFNFDGGYHAIRNMNIQETADPALGYQNFGLFGNVYLGGAVKIINTALLDATIRVVQPAAANATDKHSVYVGGLVGKVTVSGSNRAFQTARCVVDADIKVITNGTLTGNEADTVPVKVGDKSFQGGVGGFIGAFADNANLTVQVILAAVTGSIEIDKTNATDTDIAVGGVFPVQNLATLTYGKNLVNVEILGDFPKTADDAVPYAALSYNAEKMTADQGEAYGINKAQTGLLISKTEEEITAADNALVTTYSWVQAEAGKLPLPTNYTGSYATVEPALHNAAKKATSVWDGTVAGTNMTLKEMQMAFKAGGYTKIGVTTAQIANDLDIGLTDKNKPGGTWNIKSAAGLAFISAWSNGYAEITDALTGQPGAANRVPMLYKDASWGKTINVTVDIDLNNQFWIPILAYDTSNTATFNFDGGYHAIRNMNIQETADPALGYQNFGLFGNVYLGGAVKIINTVLLDATIKVTQPAAANDTDKHSVYVGGLVGKVTVSGSNRAFQTARCVVDADIKVITNGTLTGNEADTVPVKVGDKSFQGGVGGFIGAFADNANLSVQVLWALVSGSIEIEKTNATDTDIAVGGVFPVQNLATLIYGKNLIDVEISGDFPKTAADEIPYVALAYNTEKITNQGDVYGINKAQTDLLVSKTEAELISLDNGLKANAGWVQKEGGLPLPTNYSVKNYIEIVSAMDNYKEVLIFNNLGASVRTVADEYGLRFSVELNQALLKNYVAEYGMVLIPQDSLTGKLVMNSDGTTPEGALKIVAGTILDKDATTGVNTDKWIFGADAAQMNVALINIPETAAEMQLVVRAYVKLQDGSYIYGDTMVRSLMGTVNNVMASGSDADKALVYDIYNTWEGFNANGYTPAAPQA